MPAPNAAAEFFISPGAARDRVRVFVFAHPKLPTAGHFLRRSLRGIILGQKIFGLAGSRAGFTSCKRAGESVDGKINSTARWTGSFFQVQTVRQIFFAASNSCDRAAPCLILHATKFSTFGFSNPGECPMNADGEWARAPAATPGKARQTRNRRRDGRADFVLPPAQCIRSFPGAAIKLAFRARL